MWTVSLAMDLQALVRAPGQLRSRAAPTLYRKYQKI